MGNDDSKDKPKRSRRRVNRKRKALSTAKQLTPMPVMWNICQDTQEDLWQVLVIDQVTKRRIAKGPMVKGRNKAYNAFTKEIEKELDNRTTNV